MKNIEMYKKYLMSEQKSVCTISAYITDVEQMLNMVNKPDVEVEFADFVDWKNELNQTLAGKSINRKIAAVKKYYTWLVDMRMISYNPTNGISNIKNPKPVRNHVYIPMDSAKKMMDVCTNYRDKAIVAVYLTYGLRVSELINLTMNDYNKPEFDIITKGQVERHIIWTDSVRKYVRQYVEYQRRNNLSYLFVSNTDNKMDRVSLNNTIKTICNHAGINGEVSNHSLRHTCISNMIDNYGISAAQHYVGHSDIAITQLYAHNTDKQYEDMAMSVNL